MSFRAFIKQNLDEFLIEDLLTETPGQIALFAARKIQHVTEVDSRNLLRKGFSRARRKSQGDERDLSEDLCLIEISLGKPNALGPLRSTNDKRLILPDRVSTLPENFGPGFYSVFSVRGLRLDEIEDSAKKCDSISNCPQSIFAILSRIHFAGFAFGEVRASYCILLSPENRWGLLASAQLRPTGERIQQDKDIKSFHSLFAPMAKNSNMANEWRKELPGLLIPHTSESLVASLREGPFLDFPPLSHKVKALKGAYEINVNGGEQSPCGLLATDVAIAKKHENKILNFADLPALGETVPPKSDCIWEIPFGSDRSCVAFDRKGEWIRLGEVLTLSSVPDIASLKISRIDGRIRLSWDWPDSLDVAIVRFLDERDVEVFSTRLFDYQYQAQNGFVLDCSKLGTAAKIQVLGALPAGRGQWKTSSGLPEDCRVNLTATC